MAHNTLLFIKQLFARPTTTGAIIPSSESLADKMVAFAAPAEDAVIAEYGPGTGVFTRHIIRQIKDRQHFFAVEINPEFARQLRHEFPALHLHEGCASRITDYCQQEQVDRVDCVISGLPWANFPEELQRKILDAMIEVMPPGGTFVTFAYLQGLLLPAGRRFRASLGRYFTSVERSGVVWDNVPPAIIYRCRK